MPCRYYEPGEEAEILNRQYKVKIDNLTRLLCEAMQIIEAHCEAARVKAELVDWWERHKELDRQRIYAESMVAQAKAEKEAALAKLTPHERKLLGLP